MLKRIASINKIALYLPAVLFLAPLLLVKPELTIFPSDKKYKLSFYSDSTNGGQSTGSLSSTQDSTIVFDYTLHKTPGHTGLDPYAGFSLVVTEQKDFLDISPYSYLCVDLESKRAKSFVINLKTSIEGFTDPKNWRTFHFETCMVPVHLGSKHYCLPLKNFSQPQWWWKEVGQDAANLPGHADYTKLLGIDFQTVPGADNGGADHFVITRIVFTNNRTSLAVVLTGGFFLYIGAIFLILLFLKRQKLRTELKTPTYRHLDVKNRVDADAERIVAFIGSHFDSPDLTVEQVGKETGIPPAKIPAILQKNRSFSFKQYLNEIRIAESKRLLRETDRTIAEIAFTVGYNNVTHFNRVFRQSMEISPSEYRDKNKSLRL
jgi:AraC-like DNA-binding protein